MIKKIRNNDCNAIIHGDEEVYAHPDVTGKWSGDETWFVRYKDEPFDMLHAYILLDKFDKIGKLISQKKPIFTEYATATLLTKALREGCSPDILHFFIGVGIFVSSLFSTGRRK